MTMELKQHERIYRCKEYELIAHEKSCFFCRNCTDIFYDYQHGPYMFLCVEGKDTTNGLAGVCPKFVDENEGSK